jgi:hypothetical protein
MPLGTRTPPSALRQAMASALLLVRVDNGFGSFVRRPTILSMPSVFAGTCFICAETKSFTQTFQIK